MLSRRDTRRLCLDDGIRRVNGAEPATRKGHQLCHAGLLNGRKQIRIPPLGEMTLLYGSRGHSSKDAVARRSGLIASLKNSEQQTELEQLTRGFSTGTIDEDSRRLIEAISLTLGALFKLALEFHWVSVNMAHELSTIWLNAGLALRDLEEDLQDLSSSAKEECPEIEKRLAETVRDIDPLFAECQLGSYVCRNFLSHVSESRYKSAVRGRRSMVRIEPLLLELTSLHRRVAAEKGVVFEILEPLDLPYVLGIESEIRRLLHNILSNSVKYSYHSTGQTSRSIKIWSKVPFDPGFRAKRFSLVVQNYGLGVMEDETHLVTQAGYRGKQAVEEIPIGSGIGLSEVKKILAFHGGELKFRSQELHRGVDDKPTYLTEVEMILPYASERGR